MSCCTGVADGRDGGVMGYSLSNEAGGNPDAEII
jgi:hypothetical protein